MAACAYEQPVYGQLRVSNELKKMEILASPGGVRSIWLRHGLAAFKAHLRTLETKFRITQVFRDQRIYH